MIAEEEYKALTNEYQKRQQPSFCCSAERSVCLLAASTPLSQHHGAIQSQPHDSSSKLSSQESRQHNALDVLGTLDLYAVQALHGEVLIGMQCLKRSILCTDNVAAQVWTAQRPGL